IDTSNTDYNKSIRRRSECNYCVQLLTNFERIEMSPVIVVKEAGTREQYNKEIIFNGLVGSGEKRAVRFQQLEETTNQVEWKLREEGSAEMSSREIGEYVM
ncbi:transcriptional regulator NrdR, partial [Staphylococcus pseudintermedius]